MTKKEFIKYVYEEEGIRLTNDQFSGKKRISGSLWFNPVVGGYLTLYGLTEIPENWNPINVNKDIYINNSNEINPILKFINFEI